MWVYAPAAPKSGAENASKQASGRYLLRVTSGVPKAVAFDQGGLEIQLYLWLKKYATACIGADISIVPGKVGALGSKEDWS